MRVLKPTCPRSICQWVAPSDRATTTQSGHGTLSVADALHACHSLHALLQVHTATHFDAPSHYLQEAFEGGKAIESIDLNILIGERRCKAQIRPTNHVCQLPWAWLWCQAALQIPLRRQQPALIQHQLMHLQRLQTERANHT